MEIKASAPGKIILFGEHVVVYKRPAIALAINKTVDTILRPRDDNKIVIVVPSINLNHVLEITDGKIDYSRKKLSVLDYIYEVFSQFNIQQGFDLIININLPLGAGLGSSAAVTVSTIAVIAKFTNVDLSKKEIAKMAHNIEINVQKVASPIDTALSTYGGFIYLDTDSNVNKITTDINLELIVAYTQKRGNTGLLVDSVKKEYEKYPQILENIFNTVEILTNQAKSALENQDKTLIGDLMNINQGLLDSIGVNTIELSDMIYVARNEGAYGAKLTGSGGGGSIVVYAPKNTKQIFEKLNKFENAFKAEISSNGVEVTVKY